METRGEVSRVVNECDECRAGIWRWRTLTIIVAVLIVCCPENGTALDEGIPVLTTPLDGRLETLREVQRHIVSNPEAKPTMTQVERLMQEAHRFKYAHSYTRYVPAPPAYTSARREGDCKDLALWLMDRLNDPTARMVFGVCSAITNTGHAWVVWRDRDGSEWVLDPLRGSSPIPAAYCGPDRYMPQFSFTATQKFRHALTMENVNPGGYAARRGETQFLPGRVAITIPAQRRLASERTVLFESQLR